MSAGNTIAKGSVVLSTNADAVAPGLAKTEGLVKGWGSKIGGVIGGSMGGGLGAGLMMGGPWGAALAAGFAGASKLVDKFGEVSEGIDNASKKSRALGTDMGTFQGLAHAADLSNISVEELEIGLGKFRRQVEGPLEDALFNMADSFVAIEDPGERANALVAAFGKSGLKMSAMFEGGREGLKGAIEEAKSFGLALSNVDGQRIEEANDSITRLKAAGRGLMNTIILAAAPVIEKVGKLGTQILVFLRPAFEWYGRFQERLWTIGSALWDAVGDGISAVVDWVKVVSGEMFGWVGTMPTIQDVVTGVFRAVGVSAAYAWDVTKIGIGAIALVAGKFIEAGGSIVTVFREITDMMRGLPDHMKFNGFDKFADGVAHTEERVKALGGEMAKWGGEQLTFDNIGKSAIQFNAWLDKALAKKKELGDPKKPLGDGLDRVAPKFAAAIEAGSKEAYSMEVRNKFGEKAGKNPVETLLEKNQRIALETNTRLRAIERSLNNVEKF